MNLPNALSCLRILLIPVFLWMFLTAQDQQDYFVAALILLFSGITDVVDGAIARHFHMITQLGKILDPIADKLTLAAVVVALWLARPQLWGLYAMLIAKELLMLAGGLRLHHKQVVLQGSQWFGKLATVIFYIIMVIIVACPALTDGDILNMLLLLLFFMLFALLQYGMIFRSLMNELKK